MGDWIPLREFLGQHVDGLIAAEHDTKVRAVLAYHRNHILDQMELAVLRDALTKPELDAAHVLHINGHRMNGACRSAPPTNGGAGSQASRVAVRQ